MRRSGFANLPLHGGKAPAWLFQRMVKLGKVISEALVYEFGSREFLERLSNPYWFQALGCIIGFDWHSSGVTTTTLGALKIALDDIDLGVKICGGKGRHSRNALDEILANGYDFSLSERKIKDLRYASRITAKVDNSLIQDNYQLYHHCLAFNEKGDWSVVQQGLNNENSYARRYHWFSKELYGFIEEPHSGIAAELQEKNVLNMTAKQVEESRKNALDIVKDGLLLRQTTLKQFEHESGNRSKGNGNIKTLNLERRHSLREFNLPKQSVNMLRNAMELQPGNYEELIALKGVGSKTIRALALASELLYGNDLDWEDPAKYSFALGGKDGWPYPVPRKRYDKTIELLENALREAKLGDKEIMLAISRLKDYTKGI